VLREVLRNICGGVVMSADEDRTRAVIAVRKEREDARLLGEAWMDWSFFSQWSKYPREECTYIRRQMEDEDKVRVDEFLRIINKRTAELEGYPTTEELNKWEDDLAVEERALQIVKAALRKERKELDELRAEIEVEKKAHRLRVTHLKARQRGSQALNCSFCGDSYGKVDFLITSASAHICNDCVGKCVDILIKKDVSFEYTTNLPQHHLLEHLRTHLEDDPTFAEALLKEVSRVL